MYIEPKLINVVDRISAYIERCVTLIAPEKQEEVIELFESMHLLFPHWGILSCPAMHPEMRYLSSNCTSILGYDHEFLMDHIRVEKFFRLVHDEDKNDLFNCITHLHEFLETIPPEEHIKYRAVLHYRIRKENGDVIYLHDEKATLNLSGAGNLYYTLIHDLSDETEYQGVKLEIFKAHARLHKLKEYRPGAIIISLSKREKELVVLIRKGLSTKEIAWQLNISHHTVRNIKSKLFEKYNVSNSIELLNLAG